MKLMLGTIRVRHACRCFSPMFALRQSSLPHEIEGDNRRTTLMLRLVATIITLSFLFTLSVTGTSACADDGNVLHVSQGHTVKVLALSTAEAPVIEEDSEIDHLLVASYVMSVLAPPSYPRVQHPTFNLVALSRRSVPLYIAVQQFLL